MTENKREEYLNMINQVLEEHPDIAPALISGIQTQISEDLDKLKYHKAVEPNRAKAMYKFIVNEGMPDERCGIIFADSEGEASEIFYKEYSDIVTSKIEPLDMFKSIVEIR